MDPYQRFQLTPLSHVRPCGLVWDSLPPLCMVFNSLLDELWGVDKGQQVVDLPRQANIETDKESGVSPKLTL